MDDETSLNGVGLKEGKSGIDERSNSLFYEIIDSAKVMERENQTQEKSTLQRRMELLPISVREEVQTLTQVIEILNHPPHIVEHWDRSLSDTELAGKMAGFLSILSNPGAQQQEKISAADGVALVLTEIKLIEKELVTEERDDQQRLEELTRDINQSARNLTSEDSVDLYEKRGELQELLTKEELRWPLLKLFNKKKSQNLRERIDAIDQLIKENEDAQNAFNRKQEYRRARASQLSSVKESVDEVKENINGKIEGITNSPSVQLIERILDTEEGSMEKSEAVEKLLESKDPQMLPTLLTYSFRTGILTGDLRPSEEKIFSFIVSLDEEQMSKLRVMNIPGLTATLEAIRANQEFILSGAPTFTEEAQEIKTQIEVGFIELGNHLLGSGIDERMQVYVINSFSRSRLDLKEGYTILEKLMGRSQNPATQEAIISCLENRTKQVFDSQAFATLLKTYDDLDPELKSKVYQMLPGSFLAVAGNTEIDANSINKLAVILNRSVQEVESVTSLMRGIREVDKALYTNDAISLNVYFALAEKQSEILPLLAQLQEFHFMLDPDTIHDLENILRNKDTIIPAIKEIRNNFPDFEYHPRAEIFAGETILDPFELLIREQTAHFDPEHAVRLIDEVKLLPPHYQDKAREAIFKAGITTIQRDEINAIQSERHYSLFNRFSDEEQDKAINFLLDYLAENDLGGIELEYYGQIMAMIARYNSAPGRVYRFEKVQIGSQVVEYKTPSIKPEGIEKAINNGDQKEIFGYLYLLADTYRFNLEDEYYNDNVQLARTERAVIQRLYESIEDPRIKQLAAIRIFEYLLDEDVGNPEETLKFLDEIKDSSLKVLLQELHSKELDRISSGRKQHHEKIDKVEAASKEHLDHLKKVLGFTEEAKEKQLEEELQQVTETHNVTINTNYLAMIRVLNESRRFKTTWETRSRSGSEGYDGKRDRVERIMGIRAKGTRGDPHPVYGALASKNGRDEKVGGAGTGYGEVFISLRNDKIRDRTTFTYDDSFGQFTEQVLDWDDALVAKAMLNTLRGEGYKNPGVPYVEAQVLGGVSVEDIDAVNIPISYLRRGSFFGGEFETTRNNEEIQKIQSEVEELRKRFPGIKFNIIE